MLVLAALLSACGMDRTALAPPSPDRPWDIPDSSGLSASISVPAELPAQNSVAVNPVRQYDLPALIDLAQRNNPETREAWEKARQAALAVGLKDAAFLPQLSADVVGGFQRTPLPIPQTVNPSGYFVSNTREVVPALVAKWLLFDFGRREGAVDAARANSFAANVQFTAVHQKLVFAVSRDYFALGAARGRLSVAKEALKTAQIVEDEVGARRAHGLATVVQLAEARRQSAQARFNLARATGAERTAYAALIESMGVEPASRIEIADSSSRALPTFPSGDLDAFIAQALGGRTDILAAMGKIKAAEATLSSAKAAYYPTIGLEATAYENVGAVNVQGGPYYSVNEPGTAILLKLSLPLYDGGARDADAAVAQSEIQEAKAALDHARDSTVRQVTDAYVALQTGFAQYETAVTLVDAAHTAYDAALDAYRRGVGTYTDLVNDELALAQARSEIEDAHANVFTSAAALAFSTGTILSKQE